MARTLFSTVKSFCSTQNNAPKQALIMTVASMDHMLEHRDWDALGYLCGHAPTNMRGTIRRIATRCIGGIELDTKSKAAKAHRCGVKFSLGHNMTPTEVMADLRILVKEGKGITSKEVKALVTPEQPELSAAELLAKRVKALKRLEEQVTEDGLAWEDVVSAAHPEYAI